MAFLIPAALTAAATAAGIVHSRRERKKAEKAKKKERELAKKVHKKAGKGYQSGAEPYRKPKAPPKSALKGLSSKEKKKVKKDYAKAAKAEKAEKKYIDKYNKMAMAGQKEALKVGLAQNKEALKGQKLLQSEYKKAAKEYGKEKKGYKKELAAEKKFARKEAQKAQKNIEKYQPSFLPTETTFEQLQNLTPQQQGFLQNLLGGIKPELFDIRNAPLYQSGQGYLNEILSGSPEAFSRFEAPIRKEFMEQTIPQIAERFTAQNARQSSAFNQTAARAAEDLSLRLAALREGLRFEAIPQALQYAGAPSELAQRLATLGLGTSAYQYGTKPGRAGTYLGYEQQPYFLPGTPTPPNFPALGGGGGFQAPGPIFGQKGNLGAIGGGGFATGAGVSQPTKSPGFLQTVGSSLAPGLGSAIGTAAGMGLAKGAGELFSGIGGLFGGGGSTAASTGLFNAGPPIGAGGL